MLNKRMMFRASDEDCTNVDEILKNNSDLFITKSHFLRCMVREGMRARNYINREGKLL